MPANTASENTRTRTESHRVALSVPMAMGGGAWGVSAWHASRVRRNVGKQRVKYRRSCDVDPILADPVQRLMNGKGGPVAIKHATFQHLSNCPAPLEDRGVAGRSGEHSRVNRPRLHRADF